MKKEVTDIEIINAYKMAKKLFIGDFIAVSEVNNYIKGHTAKNVEIYLMEKLNYHFLLSKLKGSGK